MTDSRRASFRRCVHRMWIRRLSMPVAVGIGALISAKPLLQIAAALPGLVTQRFSAAQSTWMSLPIGDLPQLSTVLLGAALAMAMLLASRLLEE